MTLPPPAPPAPSAAPSNDGPATEQLRTPSTPSPVIGVGCWRGSGATTTALVLATLLAARGESAWLVEADPAGGVLTALLGQPAGASGLEELAFSRVRTVSGEMFAALALDVAGARVVLAPGDPFRAASCHAPRTPWVSALATLDGPVLVDVGRLRPGSSAGALLAALDVLLLVTSDDPISVASSLMWADLGGRVAAQGGEVDSWRVNLCAVEQPTAAHRVGAAELARAGEGRWLGSLPWSAFAVRHLHAGVSPRDRRLRRDPLVLAADHLAVELLGRATAARLDRSTTAPIHGGARAHR